MTQHNNSSRRSRRSLNLLLALVAMVVVTLLWYFLPTWLTDSNIVSNENVTAFEATNVLFSALAFALILTTMIMQSEELELQREEISETREELKGQKEELQRQVAHLSQQEFDTRFFHLLNSATIAFDRLLVVEQQSEVMQKLGGKGSFTHQELAINRLKAVFGATLNLRQKKWLHFRQGDGELVLPPVQIARVAIEMLGSPMASAFHRKSLTASFSTHSKWLIAHIMYAMDDFSVTDDMRSAMASGIFDGIRISFTESNASATDEVQEMNEQS